MSVFWDLIAANAKGNFFSSLDILQSMCSALKDKVEWHGRMVTNIFSRNEIMVNIYGGKKMADKKNILTYEGLKNLEDELQDLKVYKRKEVAEKIKEAREQGDLSENAEYDAAKDEQRDIEARIEEIEKILKNAEVVVEEDVDLDKINIGCRVTIKDLEYDDDLVYKIVGSTEANSLKGKISNESPVGRALIGAKKGEVIEVETQAGVLKYKIIEIERSN